MQISPGLAQPRRGGAFTDREIPLPFHQDTYCQRHSAVSSVSDGVRSESGARRLFTPAALLAAAEERSSPQRSTDCLTSRWALERASAESGSTPSSNKLRKQTAAHSLALAGARNAKGAPGLITGPALSPMPGGAEVGAGVGGWC